MKVVAFLPVLLITAWAHPIDPPSRRDLAIPKGHDNQAAELHQMKRQYMSNLWGQIAQLRESRGRIDDAVQILSAEAQSLAGDQKQGGSIEQSGDFDAEAWRSRYTTSVVEIRAQAERIRKAGGGRSAEAVDRLVDKVLEGEYYGEMDHKATVGWIGSVHGLAESAKNAIEEEAGRFQGILDDRNYYYHGAKQAASAFS
jgi:hypothetical protein